MIRELKGRKRKSRMIRELEGRRQDKEEFEKGEDSKGVEGSVRAHTL